MKKICRTCKHWEVTGKRQYGHAAFPGSWGTERREENGRCQCQLESDPDYAWSMGLQGCPDWKQAIDIIDECIHCGALLYEYLRPAVRPVPGGDPGPTEYERNGITRFWYGGEPEECEHEGIDYHGDNPWLCSMCQGRGQIEPGHTQCDACHGQGIRKGVKL